jgi:hypothetical protein
LLDKREAPARVSHRKVVHPSPERQWQPGMWHLRTETEGYMEFVHRRTGEFVLLEAPTAASKCTSRPDCPCDFCVRVRAEIAEVRSAKDEQNKSPKISSALIRRPSLLDLGAWRSAAWENSSRGPATNHSSVCAATRERFARLMGEPLRD